MRKLFVGIVLAVLFAGCGDNNDEPAPQAATPTPAEAEAHNLEGYSQGVRDYYGDAHTHAGNNVEAEYHQPPKPPLGGIGDTITLTGTNIGIRLEVTLESVKTAGDRTQVRLQLENTGITIYDAPLQSATLTYGGDTRALIKGKTCSRNFDTASLRIEVSTKRDVCLLFPAGDGEPERLQLALELVPPEAGGIWVLD